MGFFQQQLLNGFILTSIVDYGGFHEKNSTLNRDFWLFACWMLLNPDQHVDG
jgi:hypothetical protein